MHIHTSAWLCMYVLHEYTCMYTVRATQVHVHVTIRCTVYFDAGQIQDVLCAYECSNINTAVPETLSCPQLMEGDLLVVDIIEAIMRQSIYCLFVCLCVFIRSTSTNAQVNKIVNKCVHWLISVYVLHMATELTLWQVFPLWSRTDQRNTTSSWKEWAPTNRNTYDIKGSAEC